MQNLFVCLYLGVIFGTTELIFKIISLVETTIFPSAIDHVLSWN